MAPSYGAANARVPAEAGDSAPVLRVHSQLRSTPKSPLGWAACVLVVLMVLGQLLSRSRDTVPGPQGASQPGQASGWDPQLTLHAKDGGAEGASCTKSWGGSNNCASDSDGKSVDCEYEQGDKSQVRHCCKATVRSGGFKYCASTAPSSPGQLTSVLAAAKGAAKGAAKKAGFKKLAEPTVVPTGESGDSNEIIEGGDLPGGDGMHMAGLAASAGEFKQSITGAAHALSATDRAKQVSAVSSMLKEKIIAVCGLLDGVASAAQEIKKVTGGLAADMLDISDDDMKSLDDVLEMRCENIGGVSKAATTLGDVADLLDIVAEGDDSSGQRLCAIVGSAAFVGSSTVLSMLLAGPTVGVGPLIITALSGAAKAYCKTVAADIEAHKEVDDYKKEHKELLLSVAKAQLKAAKQLSFVMGELGDVDTADNSTRTNTIDQFMQLVKDTGLDVAVEEARQLTADDGSDPRLWTSWGAVETVDENTLVNWLKDKSSASILRKSCEMTDTSFFYPTAVECMFNEPFYFNKSNFKAEAKRRGQKANLHLTEGWTTVLESPAELGDATKQKQLAYYALGSLKRLRDEPPAKVAQLDRGSEVIVLFQDSASGEVFADHAATVSGNGYRDRNAISNTVSVVRNPDGLDPDSLFSESDQSNPTSQSCTGQCNLGFYRFDHLGTIIRWYLPATETTMDLNMVLVEDLRPYRNVLRVETFPTCTGDPLNSSNCKLPATPLSNCAHTITRNVQVEGPEQHCFATPKTTACQLFERDGQVSHQPAYVERLENDLEWAHTNVVAEYQLKTAGGGWGNTIKPIDNDQTKTELGQGPGAILTKVSFQCDLPAGFANWRNIQHSDKSITKLKTSSNGLDSNFEVQCGNENSQAFAYLEKHKDSGVQQVKNTYYGSTWTASAESGKSKTSIPAQLSLLDRNFRCDRDQAVNCSDEHASRCQCKYDAVIKNVKRHCVLCDGKCESENRCYLHAKAAKVEAKAAGLFDAGSNAMGDNFLTKGAANMGMSAANIRGAHFSNPACDDRCGGPKSDDNADYCIKNERWKQKGWGKEPSQGSYTDLFGMVCASIRRCPKEILERAMRDEECKAPLDEECKAAIQECRASLVRWRCPASVSVLRAVADKLHLATEEFSKVMATGALVFSAKADADIRDRTDMLKNSLATVQSEVSENSGVLKVLESRLDTIVDMLSHMKPKPEPAPKPEPVPISCLAECEKMVFSLHDGQKKNSKKAKDCKDNCRDKETTDIARN